MAGENLSLPMSRSDVHRAANLKWRNAPPGLSPALADEFMNAVKAGKTVGTLVSGLKQYGPAMISRERFNKHCELDPEWAQEVKALSAVTVRFKKGANHRKKTHCKNGHPFAVYQRLNLNKGCITRQCRQCERDRLKIGGPVKPDMIVKVRAAIERGLTISALTAARRPTRLLAHQRVCV
jgi:hypothetical protein